MLLGATIPVGRAKTDGVEVSDNVEPLAQRARRGARSRTVVTVDLNWPPQPRRPVRRLRRRSGQHRTADPPLTKRSERRSPRLCKQWIDAGSVVVARFDLTAMRLADGRVLVTGGLVTDGVTASTESLRPGAGHITDRDQIERTT
jgi:hypothetical protein